MRWHEGLTLVLAVVAILLSLFSLYQSHQSTELAKEAMRKSEWPWFAVNNMDVEHPDEKSFRVHGALKHYTGGPALNVRFAIGIRGEFSELDIDTPALLPGADLRIASPLVAGPKLEVGDVVSWRFTYSDVSGRCYESLQDLMFRPAGGVKFVKLVNKQIDCEP